MTKSSLGMCSLGVVGYGARTVLVDSLPFLVRFGSKHLGRGGQVVWIVGSDDLAGVGTLGILLGGRGGDDGCFGWGDDH